MASGAHILVVDDEPEIRDFLSYNLEKEGYSVDTATTGLEAISKSQSKKPDVILMDVMMPEMDGMEAVQSIRSIKALKNVHVMFLTARDEEYSEIAALSMGGDDYVIKPVKPKVLMARIKAVLRRSSESKQKQEFDDLIIDRDRYSVVYQGNELRLPKKEYELLTLLASKPGKVYTRDEILEKVWGSEVIVGDRTIDVHVRRIREKLNDRYITTLKGVGYKFSP